jgi:hypothetical protein
LSGKSFTCTSTPAYPASRVPLSAAAGGEYAGDLRILDLTAEVKARANGEGFKQLEAWLGAHDLLLLRRNPQRPLVFMPWSTYLRLIQFYQQGDAHGDA